MRAYLHACWEKPPMRGKTHVPLLWLPRSHAAGAGSVLAFALCSNHCFRFLRKVLLSLFQRLEWSVFFCILLFYFPCQLELPEDSLLYEPPGSCLRFLRRRQHPPHVL